MMCNFWHVLTGLVSDRPGFPKMRYTIAGSEWWGENDAHCFIFHVRERKQTSKEKKVGTNSGQTVTGSWRFSSLKGKAFQAPFKFSWFLGFLFHSDLGYGPVVSTWGALRYSFNLGGVWNIRQQAGFLSRRCGYSFFTSCFPCFALRHGFVNICLSQLFKSGLEWCMIFLEQALGIIKEATWSYCIVFCHFQSTDLTLVG